MSGHLPPHAELEDALARMTGRPAALVFGSGFLTNLGAISALVGPHDAILADKLVHASLVDGARLSGARLHRYRHGDPGHLDALLKKESGARRRMVITDSVFSMDGDQAPLAEVAAVARRHDALLMVDEAHAIGVLGPGGGGLCRALPADLAPDLVVGTLSKALGGYGGFVAGSARMKEFLINRARTFIYSTGLPPSVAAAGLEAARILEAEPGLGEQLMRRARLFSRLLRERGLDVPEAASPILPIMVGDNRRALALAERLRARGVLAVAVRPPTVPVGTARLRLSVTLAHRPEDLDRAAGVIAEAVAEVAPVSTQEKRQ
jgi:8-amino-7-oxononanoate synthase